MKKLISVLDKISDIGGVVSGVMICAGVSLVIAEIIVRGVFSRTLYISEEYSGYLMAGLTYMALGYTLKERAHIRMTFIHSILSERGKVILDLFCFIVGFLFSVGFTYVTFGLFWDSLVSGTRSMQISETPLAIPQAFLPIGSFIMTGQFLAEILRCFGILTGKLSVSLVEESKELGR